MTTGKSVEASEEEAHEIPGKFGEVHTHPALLPARGPN
jgi:hypothetical protein